MKQERVNVCYDESKIGRYVPRAILVDLDPVIIENIKVNFGKLYKAENLLAGRESANNIWGKGHHNAEGADMASQVIEKVRSEVEKCDNTQSIQVSHSIGGGTGSGLGSAVISKLMEQFRGNILASFTHAPFSGMTDIPVEPYNAVLSTHSLIENIDQTYFFDNNALNRICTQIFKIDNASYNEFNHLVSCAMSGITSCLRFHGQLNDDMRKLAVSLIPFPRLRFFIPGIAPLVPSHGMGVHSLTMPDITEHMLDYKYYLTTCNDWEKRKNLAMGVIVRGKVHMKEIYGHVSAVQTENKSMFIEDIPNSVKVAICKVAAKKMETSSTYVAHTSAITTLLDDMLWQFDLLLERNSFVHKYTAEGMELTEFREAKENVKALSYEYKDFECN